MHNFISCIQTDSSRHAKGQPFKRNRRIAMMITAVLVVSAAVLSIIIPQESVVAALTSATFTPPKPITAAATSTRTSVLPTSTPTGPGLRNPSFLHDKSLIEIDDVCDAPCWRGITPGKTKYVDALKILLDAPDLNDAKTESIPDAFPAIGASFRATGGEPCCQIISEDGQIVASIFLQIAPDMTIKQLIDARGEPEYALGTPGSDTEAIINLFYPEQNMIVFAFVAGAETGRISETSEIIGVYYTTADRMDLGIKLSSLYGWKGYQPFSAYAPDALEPDYKITQSVTLTPSPTATPRPR